VIVSTLLEKAGGRDRDRTCDPYDVNILPRSELADFCGVCAAKSGTNGNTFGLRSRFGGSVNLWSTTIHGLRKAAATRLAEKRRDGARDHGRDRDGGQCHREARSSGESDGRAERD
jgi:hypothetical protein